METGASYFPPEKTDFNPHQTTSESLQDASLEAITRGRRLAAHHMSERPISVLALSFVVGAGAGTLIGSLLFDQLAQQRTTTSGLLQRISDTVSDAVSQARVHPFK